MVWLGANRGYLYDWVTQQWVRVTGRRLPGSSLPWLHGPSGTTHGIGPRFFDEYAAQAGFQILPETGPRGLVPDLSALTGGAPVLPSVSDFYEKTSEYHLDCWCEWSPLFRPFGRLLALIFSRRLEQLNVPLTGLDTHRGMTSRVLVLRGPQGERQTAWVRQLVVSQRTVYAGSYGTCEPPGFAGLCIKVCFPLPNGRAVVIMRPEVHPDGGLSLHSDGRNFGDPGFYFVVERGSAAWARYVRTMKESIHVYAAEPGTVRADHTLRLWGCVFLRLHYRLHNKHTPTSRYTLRDHTH